jgi:hypothetical protein
VREHPSWQWRPEYEQVWGGPDECLETIADVHADDGELMESRGRMIAVSPALLSLARDTLYALKLYRTALGDTCESWIDLGLIERHEAVIRQATESAAEST